MRKSDINEENNGEYVLEALEEGQPTSALFLDEVMEDLRWSTVKEEWSSGRSLQALVCSVLPSYWDIASDIWLGITFLTITCDSEYCQIGKPDYFWGR